MIDLHTHTIFSDGSYNPAEHIRRAEVKGYNAIAITDHADASNLEHIIKNVKKAVLHNNMNSDIRAITGVELTHVRPAGIKELVVKARELGADIVVVHGETIVEPVIKGTNMAAIEAKVDILAHPGLISSEEARLAACNNVFIEITSRKGHCYTNSHVYKKALEQNANMVFNNDAHADADLVSKQKAFKIMKGAGIEESAIEKIFNNSKAIVDKIFKKGDNNVNYC